MWNRKISFINSGYLFFTDLNDEGGGSGEETLVHDHESHIPKNWQAGGKKTTLFLLFHVS